jgi:prolyl 4-hydroxylase
MSLYNFIEKYKVPENICDELLIYYNKNTEYTYKRKDIKMTNDSVFFNSSQHPTILKFFLEISKAIKHYMEKYNLIESLITSVDNKIQHYQPGVGYTTLHYERHLSGSQARNRQVVYMLYLNTIKEEGGTEFPFQGVITKPVKGDLILWPADFTHPHRGIIAPKEEKFIVTGWFEYNGFK